MENTGDKFIRIEKGALFSLDSLTFDETAQRIIRQGREALVALEQEQTWEKWIAIGYAIDTARNEVMHKLGLNQPRGRSYSVVMGAWLRAMGFAEPRMSDSTRSRLLDCIEHLTEITAWRQSLSPASRMMWTHPATVLKQWKSAMARTGTERGPVERKPNAKDEALAYLQAELDAANRKLAELGGDAGPAESDPGKVRELVTKWRDRAAAAEAERDQYRQRAEEAEALLTSLREAAQGAEAPTPASDSPEAEAPPAARKSPRSRTAAKSPRPRYKSVQVGEAVKEKGGWNVYAMEHGRAAGLDTEWFETEAEAEARAEAMRAELR